jgi:hypothetical protein
MLSGESVSDRQRRRADDNALVQATRNSLKTWMHESMGTELGAPAELNFLWSVFVRLHRGQPVTDAEKVVAYEQMTALRDFSRESGESAVAILGRVFANNLNGSAYLTKAHINLLLNLTNGKPVTSKELEWAEDSLERVWMHRMIEYMQQTDNETHLVFEPPVRENGETNLKYETRSARLASERGNRLIKGVVMKFGMKVVENDGVISENSVNNCFFISIAQHALRTYDTSNDVRELVREIREKFVNEDPSSRNQAITSTSQHAREAVQLINEKEWVQPKLRFYVVSMSPVDGRYRIHCDVVGPTNDYKGPVRECGIIDLHGHFEAFTLSSRAEHTQA